jgi:hypothetical protein
VQDGNGRPDFHFVQARYTGSAVTADRGRVEQRSLITFRVAMKPQTAAQLQAARTALGASELRPLPIQSVEGLLIYAPATDLKDATDLPEGHFEQGPQDASGRPAEFWTSRSYSLGLDAATSELFWGAIQKGQVVLTLGYYFYAADGPKPRSRGIVHVGNLDITVDAARWPELFRRVDLGSRVPPDYPLLDVYCYDFRDALHPGLYEKQVEVEAEGVGGRPVTARARFGQDQPDLYAQGVRFRVAVRLDRPYRYRVTQITADGRSTVSEWRPRSSWADLLDVTTPAEPGQPGEER